MRYDVGSVLVIMALIGLLTCTMRYLLSTRRWTALGDLWRPRLSTLLRGVCPKLTRQSMPMRPLNTSTSAKWVSALVTVALLAVAVGFAHQNV